MRQFLQINKENKMAQALESGYVVQNAGHKLYWQYHQAKQARAQLLLVHGIGEHSGRYQDIIARFLSMGLNVFAYDQYGHGKSDGERGNLDSDSRLVEDLRDISSMLRQRASNLPLILFGHSMGGAVVADYVLHYQATKYRPDLVILSSPALKPHFSVMAKLGSAVMQNIAPHLVIRHYLSMKISHRPEINEQLKNDPLCHKKISGILASFILQAGDAVRENGHQWDIPTLLLYAGKDYLVNPKGSAEFAAQAAHCVEAHCFEHHYHEIFHELDAESVYDRVQLWLRLQLAKA